MCCTIKRAIACTRRLAHGASAPLTVTGTRGRLQHVSGVNAALIDRAYGGCGDT